MHHLKEFDLGGGRTAVEKTCMNYTCRYCGAKAVAGNFVADLCLQVAARHMGLCGAYVETDQYMGYVNECSTCSYFDDETKQCRND